MSEEVADVASFMEALRRLRRLAGISYRMMARMRELGRKQEQADSAAQVRRGFELRLQQLKFLRLLSVLLMQMVQVIVRRLVPFSSPRQRSMLADVAASPHVTRGPSFYPTQADQPWGALAT